ncbi:protein kinase-like domain, concanavalin A-like lectin/glucanase domain protein [Tanacetum coccineum]
MAGVDINTLTMEQYLALARGNQAPGVVKLKIECNVNFKIKSQFMKELREDTFSKNKNEDAHDHIDRVLNIVSLFNIPGVSQDAVMLRVFPFTLTGAAKRWVDRLTPGAVDTWDLLKIPFIQRYCPLSKTAKQLEDIQTLSRKAMNHYTRHGNGSSNNNDGLATIVSKLDNLGCDMKKLIENVHAIQVGCQLCGGDHLDRECPLSEQVYGIEEVKYGEYGRSFPNSDRNNGRSGYEP